MSRIQNKIAFINAARSIVGDTASTISRTQIEHAAHTAGVKFPSWLTTNPKYRDKWGSYILPSIEEVSSPSKDDEEEDEGDGQTILCGDCKVPEIDSTYIPSVNHDIITRIVNSMNFHPCYISGRSGYGKTMTVEQVCALSKREFILQGINEETTEDHLLGGMRLVNGETRFQYGPVALAMMRGAVILFDEVDFGTTKILCLQRVMEGKPVYISRINKWIHPKKGFTPFLTGNTKGRGDMTGRFIGTRAMNDAFLERVNTYLVHNPPDASVETRIVATAMNGYECVDEQFANFLVAWARKTREDFANRALQDEICTRRLRQIVANYAIRGKSIANRVDAIRDAISRFDEVTVETMIEAYKAIDYAVSPAPDKANNMGAAPTGTTAPF